MKVLLDPYLIMLPQDHYGQERAAAYLDSLERWLVNDFPGLVQVLHSSACTYLLIEKGLFPFFFNLATVIADNNIQGYDARDISRLTSGIFESLEEVEKYLPAARPLSDLSLIPSDILNRLPADVSDKFRESIVKIALKQISADSVLTNTKVGSVDDDSNISSHLNISGTLDHSDKTVFGIVLPDASSQLDIEIDLVFDHEDILNSLKWVDLWSHTQVAVEKGYYSAITAGERGAFHLGSYRTGPRFVDSLRTTGLHAVSGRIKSVYETCALVICGRAKSLVGINPRRLRGAVRSDGATPMRADVSQEGAGFRLHYWQCPDGTVELSCVNVHNDYRIY